MHYNKYPIGYTTHKTFSKEYINPPFLQMGNDLVYWLNTDVQESHSITVMTETTLSADEVLYIHNHTWSQFPAITQMNSWHFQVWSVDSEPYSIWIHFFPPGPTFVISLATYWRCSPISSSGQIIETKMSPTPFALRISSSRLWKSFEKVSSIDACENEKMVIYMYRSDFGDGFYGTDMSVCNDAFLLLTFHMIWLVS